MKIRIATRLMLMLLAVAALAPFCRAQAKLLGDWAGTTSIQGTEYHVIMHVTAATDGALTVTIDSADLGVTGIPTTGVTFADPKISFNVDTYHGVYTGSLNKDGTEITGTFMQDQEVPLSFTRMAAGAAAPAAGPPPASMSASMSGSAPSPAPLAGDWQGTLTAGGMQLRLVLHIVAAKDGSLTATLDSLDQGAMGIPVNTVTLKDSKLDLTVDAVHGTYDGTVNKDASEIDGTWSQGAPMDLNFKRAAPQAAVKPAPPSDIDGTYAGTLDAQGKTLHILLKLVNTGDGLTAQMQSTDQSTVWIAASSVNRDSGTLTVTFKGLGAEFSGKISADHSSIDGTFSQGGGSIPLLVKRM